MPTDLNNFVVSKTAVGLSLRTVEWYAAIVKRYIDWTRDQGQKAEKPETVEAYLAYLRTEGKKPATISGCYRSLSVYFKWLVERRKLRHSPLEHIAPPKSPIKRVKHITPEQFEKLYESFPNDTWWRRRDHALLLVMFFCGLRANELLSLKLDSIDRDRNIILVTEGKGGKDRDVPCALEVIAAIDYYLALRPEFDSNALFLARNKNYYSPRGPLLHDGLKEVLRRRCKVAGIPHFSPHKFRHAYAMTFANAGMPLSALAASMGHSSVNVTEKFYARWQTESLSEVYTNAFQKITMIRERRHLQPIDS